MRGPVRFLQKAMAGFGAAAGGFAVSVLALAAEPQLPPGPVAETESKASAAAPAPDPVLAELAATMAGSYSSSAQAAAQPEAYRDIHLTMVAIWPDRADGPWLYVEQAAASSLERPYRQRVYQLVRTGQETIESRVYALPEPPLQYAGAAVDPAKLSGLTPDALTLRAGCAVVLKKSGPDWTGSTVGKQCGSDLRGASYATSEVRISASGMESWDRGYDADDKQVWGAEQGPYIFVRE
ncbi:MAG: chromophore lyase CpcT/CpeT [Acidobacteria bacterium]|jgi:hypothetical protein|nr:chromophore lyase CpcT/CpeT [Acidobacteriota bacterium]